MKKMLLIEYASMKKVLIQQSFLSVGVTLFVVVFLGLPYMIIPMITAMMSMTSIMTQISYDERNGWESYRMILPLTRGQTVRGRYVFSVIVIAVGIVLGAVLYGLMYLVAPLFADINALEALAQGISETDMIIFAATVLAIISFMLLLSAVIFPLSFRFGMTKAVRWLPLVFIAFVFSIGGAFEFIDPQLVSSALSVFNTREGILFMTAAIGAVCIILFCASSMLSKRLYMKREF